ncbi:hypothetical protein RN001_011930 [Aquatica leii]|uniref:Uncharacterized protein n=1 Tax=Aquatica leii TaxID=1421715 RepID=A0AAN7QEB5_9COLE|nr:hypothetical protein RN001_011930 [Aquatica leii]
MSTTNDVSDLSDHERPVSDIENHQSSPKRPSSDDATATISAALRDLKYIANEVSKEPLVNEFVIFGNSVAAQLQNLTTVNVLLAHAQIQSLLTKFRICELQGVSATAPPPRINAVKHYGSTPPSSPSSASYVDYNDTQLPSTAYGQTYHQDTEISNDRNFGYSNILSQALADISYPGKSASLVDLDPTQIIETSVAAEDQPGPSGLQNSGRLLNDVKENDSDSDTETNGEEISLHDTSESSEIYDTLEMIFNKYIAVTIVSFLIVDALGAAVLNRRSSDDDNQLTAEPIKICHNSTPCGWAVYKRFTRMIDYFMKNNCVCPPEKNCIRTDDDISVAAFVYRCKEGSKKDDNQS